MPIGTCDNCDRHNVPVRHLTGTYVGDTTQCFLCTGYTDPDPYGELEMTEEQIKHMVNRFLSWKLPESFNPDGGISFKKTFNEHTAHPMKHEPSGTNLFDATQADAMVRHMIEGMPA